MSPDEKWNRLTNISQFVYLELGRRNLHRSCIHGSALLLKVLHGTGFTEAYPLTVGVAICNAEYLEHSKTHGPPQDDEDIRLFNEAECLLMTVGVGKGVTLSGEEGWDGHLVIIVPKASGERHAVIDLTIVQLDRREWGAPMSPQLLLVGDAFLTGRESQFQRRDLFMFYEARPDDHSYRDDGNLLAVEGLEQAAANVIKNLKLSGIVE